MCKILILLFREAIWRDIYTTLIPDVVKKMMADVSYKFVLHLGEFAWYIRYTALIRDCQWKNDGRLVNCIDLLLSCREDIKFMKYGEDLQYLGVVRTGRHIPSIVLPSLPLQHVLRQLHLSESYFHT